MDKKLEQFFRFFPESTIVVAPWDMERRDDPERLDWRKTSVKELKRWNSKGWAIFFTTCDMHNLSHLNEDFKDIRTWFCEIDLLTKEEKDSEDIPESKKLEEREERRAQMLGHLWMIEERGLYPPSFIINTPGGFHVYWLAWHEEKMDKDYTPAGGLYKPSRENFDYIQREIGKRLVFKKKGLLGDWIEYGADSKAKKTVQLMRVPGFFNNKKGKKKLVSVLTLFTQHDGKGGVREFCEDEWFGLFGDPKKEDPYKKVTSEAAERIRKKRMSRKLKKKSAKKGKYKRDVFSFASGMPQEEALMAFSGTEYVGGETYELVPTAKGYNIRINGGSGTSCFIHTADNTLMGCDTGSEFNGPTIIQWVQYCQEQYYGAPLTKSALAKVLKKVLWKE